MRTCVSCSHARHECGTFEMGNMDIVRVMPGTAPTAATRDRPQLTRSELMREDLPVLGTPLTLRGGELERHDMGRKMVFTCKE